MFNLIKSIYEGAILEIAKHKYRVLAMARYVTESDTDKWYVKIQLENRYVLVVAPYDAYMYFGQVGKPYPCNFPAPNSIEYHGELYTKDAEDYQIVKEFLFGDVLTMEGEVKFADFSYRDHLISLGVVQRTQERADVYAKNICLTDVRVI